MKREQKLVVCWAKQRKQNKYHLFFLQELWPIKILVTTPSEALRECHALSNPCLTSLGEGVWIAGQSKEQELNKILTSLAFLVLFVHAKSTVSREASILAPIAAESPQRIKETIGEEDNYDYLRGLEAESGKTAPNKKQKYRYKKAQVTRTTYDNPISDATIAGQFSGGQQNTSNRVATVTFEQTLDADPTTFDRGTHYSYDPHGNVDVLVQDYKQSTTAFGSRFKKINYVYDLISGNVRGIHYQSGLPIEEYYHTYYYDADNRLSTVYTSAFHHAGYELRNSHLLSSLWSRDARYHYYEHGPMARMELGTQSVQGTDYVYTINGWMKGANSNILQASRDAGKDGLQSTQYSPYLIIVLVIFFSENKSINFENGMSIIIKSLPYQFLYALLLYFLESEEYINTSWAFYTVLFFLIPVTLLIGLIKIYSLIKR